MRRLANCKNFEPIQWVSMRHEADCWIPACAMAAGASYEDAEEVFGSGAEYSKQVLETSTARNAADPTVADEAKHAHRVYKLFLTFKQWIFFVERGFYPLLIPDQNPVLKLGRRYLLSASSCDPNDPNMSHVIVVDETGKVFDPEPTFTLDGNYAITNYRDLVGWEIVKATL